MPARIGSGAWGTPVRLTWPKPARSLAGRLALAVAGSVAAALMLAAALSIWREVDRYGTERFAALTAVAEVFASGSAGATAADDADAASATLRAIGRIPSITYGAIERPDGTILAEQGLGLRLTRDADLDDRDALSLGTLLSTRTLKARAAIHENGRVIGRVVLVADTSDLFAHILGVAGAAAMTSLLAIAIGIGVSLQLQRSVVRPLAALSRTMEAVGERHDYTQRAAVSGDDEVGKLAGTFNALLGAVNERDRRLAEHGERLEDEVRARTADLHEAKQAAESANAAKSSFLATMSHEIRTPMNGMLVMAELLAGSELPTQQRRYAQVVAQSGKSLLAIIDDILDFAKVEAGKLELERVALDPADLADTAVTLFSERARKAGLDLSASIAPDVPSTILGDPVRLGQVVSNFVSNALKFTAHGSIQIRLERDPSGREMVISVVDTGIGIPQEQLASIFGAFAQADPSTTRRFGGTGLGLSIAERLVVAMGGRVGVESREGVGSRFFARIPLEGAQTARAVPLSGGAIRDVVLRVSGEGTRAALAASLSAAGFRPTQEAPSGPAHWILDAAAFATFAGRPPRAGRVVVLAALGDAAAERAVSTGASDAVLRWPVIQAEWRPVLAALATGAPLAPAIAHDVIRAKILPQFPAARMLVADDSAVNREVAIGALGRCGIRDVVAVTDGAAAVAASAAGRFDLILMDGSMPVLDGAAAARAIRRREASEGAARVPIVALTADVLSGAAAWQEAGMDGFLGKPFTLEQIAALLQRHLRSEAGSTEDTAAPAPVLTGEADVALIDAEIWTGLTGLGDAGFVGRIAQLYRSQAPVVFESLEAAVRSGDQAGIAKTVHSLKSMSLNIGARQLAASLAPVELAARRGVCSLAEAELRAIRSILDRTIVRLDGLELAARRAA